MKIDLNNKVALVTGAAQGIGFETAKTLCQAGAQVIISDINKAAGEEAVKNFNKKIIMQDLSIVMFLLIQTQRALLIILSNKISL
ncbi:Acyl-coenzyme A synthetase/AMP-(fatty) acid ligase (Acs) (PDB:4B2O) (PUBMED:14638756) [Commensalibacter communis]|nr:SDR family NAD(P)-dependent oxidoreductase [Commensalibacter communis]CAI3948063.1 Acyl-coenzyme A synthetase/AMP-(fatty) acid ligase (Acs) (PDB:4B2O) (PUBMED:14638756) [Commensalibacter communis]CAI3949392.1 Acyl-coenzyme A synthetase/AMP-(fatty) acid ligase (Acs) (PDB:4B2O) (PUBMED:14638756) [Commensalibacter communis]